MTLRIIIDKYKLDNIKLEGIIFDEEIIDNLIDKQILFVIIII